MPTLRCVSFLVALLLATMPAAAGDSRAMEAALAEFVKDHVSIDDGEPEDTLSNRLLQWAKAGATLAELDARTAASYGVPAGLAHELVAMTLRSAQIRFDDDAADERRRIEARRVALAAKYPDAWLAFEEAMRDVAQFDDCDGARIDALLATRPDPEGTRRRIEPAIDCLELLAPITSAPGAGTESVVAFARKVEDWTGGAFGLAMLRVAVARVDADPAWPAADAARLRSRRVRSEIEHDRLTAAIAALPAPGSAAFDALVAELSGLERLDLAGAAFAIGRPDLVRQWRTLADQPSPLGVARVDLDAYSTANAEARAKHRAQEAEREQVRFRQRRELLAWALGEREGDPFALLVARLDGIEVPLGDTPWPVVQAVVARREGYPMLAYSHDPPDADYVARELREARTECYRCAPELLASIDSTFAQWATPDPAVPVVADVATPDTRPAALLARIDQAIDAAPAGWTEHPLPAAMRTAHASAKDEGECDRCTAMIADAAAPAWRARLPRGELVRWERQGDRIVALTASQSLDPVGEISSGGYWVSLSDDGGATFAPPAYTGLRVFAPYVVRGSSKLPMLEGDTLQLEVAVRELDAEHVTLPPVVFPIKRRADDLFLRIALADLQRDSDDDGLPDPIEAAMLLDAHAADTDGDGIVDGADMLPNVPWRDAGDDDRGAALALVLEEVFGRELGGIITTSAHAADGPATGGAIGNGSTASNQRGVVFLEAPADALAPLHLRKPVVVLGQAQVERLRKARGAFYPFSISGFALNRAGDEGVATWSAGWTGGAFHLRKKDGRWTLETTSAWITALPAGAPAIAGR
jgi:hypothetical protein